MRYCRNLKSHDKGSVQAQASLTSYAPNKNHFYALSSIGEQETSPDVVTDMLKSLILMCLLYLIRVLLCPLLHL